MRERNKSRNFYFRTNAEYIVPSYMQKRIECKIFGRVQLVMFRDFVQRKARKLGLLGTVKNNPDGSVSAVAEGGEETLKKFLVLIRKGSVLSRVEHVEEKWLEGLGEYKKFDILY